MITGKLRDTETVMRSLEGGGWKSASNGNSLATYPTSSTVLRGGESGDARTLPDWFHNCHDPIAHHRAIDLYHAGLASNQKRTNRRG
jgi:hypothetical protein